MALVAAEQEECVTNNRLQLLLDTHTVNSNKILSSLVDKGFLEADGVGRGTKYHLCSMFDVEISSDIEEGSINIVNDVKLQEDEARTNLDVRLNEDETKIINYIVNHGFITNSLCRSELDLKKHKSVKLFNSLVKKEKIEKVGTGNQIKYILKHE